MSIEVYDNEIREVSHFTDCNNKKYIIINQDTWYPCNEYTDEEARIDYAKKHNITLV